MSSSKSKKSKKKGKQPPPDLKSKDLQSNKKIFTYFTNEEIAEIKSVLKIKDVTGVHLIIAATFLHKFELVKELLADGHNINQTGQNNMTSLIWAVKCKYLDIIDYLLGNGADPTIKTDNGDNVLIVALENKLWDEQSFINLWRAVKKISFIDVNFTNKNGHNMLHMCVRRDWEELLRILLTEKPNVDAANSNGVTPLMLACFRTNLNIIEILINAKADVLKEDNHGRMPLCYGISSTIKVLKPPFLVVDRIVSELKNKSSLEAYIQRRIHLIIATAKKPEISCATSAMLLKIVVYIVHHTEEGIRIFLRENIFQKLIAAVENSLENLEAVKFILEVSCEILSYNEQSVGFSQDLYNKCLADLQESDMGELSFEVISKNCDLAKIAFNLVLLSFTNDETWCKLLEENSDVIVPFFNGVQLHSLEDSGRMKFLKNRKRKLKKLLESLEISTTVPVDAADDKKKSDSNGVNYSKRSRRRSRAIKAKLTKIKSAELSKRLNLPGKKCKTDRDLSVENPAEESPRIVEESKDLPIKNNSSSSNIPAAARFIVPEKTETRIITTSSVSNTSMSLVGTGGFSPNFNCCGSSFPKWREKVNPASSTYFLNTLDIDPAKLSFAYEALKSSAKNFKYDRATNLHVNLVVDYLRQLVMLLVRKLKETWQKEHSHGICNCPESLRHKSWLFTDHLQEVEAREREILAEVQKNFEQLIGKVRELLHKNLRDGLRAVTRVEGLILQYEFRGVKMLDYLCASETLLLKYSTANQKFQQNPHRVLEHVQNVLNGLEDSSAPDLTIQVEVVGESTARIVDFEEPRTMTTVATTLNLYPLEMSLVPQPPPVNKRKQIEAQLNTIANGFHLINSIMSLCDDEEVEHQDGQMDVEDSDMERRRCYKISDLNHPLQKCKYANNKSPQFLDIPGDYVPKRLKSQIASLQSLKTYQRLLGNEIRISVKEQRVNYVISAGINFSAVELGLDINNQPLAVKRIPRESWVGKIVKTLVDPLLGFIDTHILHYFACEYEGNELILATPLCKWNMAQYVHILRQSADYTMHGLGALQVVKQFLEGLMVLHKCDPPIVHGNLKPSNVFIDFNGMVKIAEFGIHKALYKIIEAPQSSLIWFAKETLEIYRNSSIVECSVKTDIQVAGMLVYFILSHGKHGFGDDPEEMLRNMHEGAPKIVCRNVDLQDLLTWMMSADYNERPNIDQVLSHPFFWSPAKKWNFIRCCSGVNQSSYLIPINIDKLHRSIDTFSDNYIQIDWQEIVRAKYPDIKISDTKHISGLLKFIKYCDEHQRECRMSDAELSCTIQTIFPSLAVSLFRTLQNTNWLKHGLFMPFSVVNAGMF